MKKLWMIGLVMLVLLAGCGGGKTLPADEAAAFAAQVDDVSENLLMGLSNGDYDAYVRDMDATMKKVSTEAEFDKTRSLIIDRIGKYVSRQTTQVVDQKQFRIIFYDTQFQDEDHVTVKVVFNMDEEPPLVSGLWFDSPKLRQK